MSQGHQPSSVRLLRATQASRDPAGSTSGSISEDGITFLGLLAVAVYDLDEIMTTSFGVRWMVSRYYRFSG